jgi:hypothetical protein
MLLSAEKLFYIRNCPIYVTEILLSAAGAMLAAAMLAVVSWYG